MALLGYFILDFSLRKRPGIVKLGGWEDVEGCRNSMEKMGIIKLFGLDDFC